MSYISTNTLRFIAIAYFLLFFINFSAQANELKTARDNPNYWSGQVTPPNRAVIPATPARLPAFTGSGEVLYPQSNYSSGLIFPADKTFDLS